MAIQNPNLIQIPSQDSVDETAQAAFDAAVKRGQQQAERYLKHPDAQVLPAQKPIGREIAQVAVGDSVTIESSTNTGIPSERKHDPLVRRDGKVVRTARQISIGKGFSGDRPNLRDAIKPVSEPNLSMRQQVWRHAEARNKALNDPERSAS